MKEIEVIDISLDELEIDEKDFGPEAEAAAEDARGDIDGE